MKKLISTHDVEVALEQGQKAIYIDKNTIITPLAKDIAKLNDIEFSMEVVTGNIDSSPNSCEGIKNIGEQLDMKMIYKVFEAMEEKGLLNEMLDWLSDKPYTSEGEVGGFKVIRGNTVRFSPLNTGNPKDKVFYQEFIKKEEPDLSAGLLSIEESSFGRELTHNEVGYLIEGNMDVNINQRKFTVYPGDIFYIPAGSKAILTSNNKTKLFYVKYRGN